MDPHYSSQVLFWPSDKSASLSTRNAAEGGDNGYVVGWETINDWNCCETSTTTKKKRIRTTICVCVVPVQPNEDLGASGDCSLERIRRALNSMSHQYDCQLDCDEETRTKGVKSINSRHCCACSCYKSLKIVGLWKPRGTNDNTADRIGAMPPADSFHSLYPTPFGPWWASDADGKSDERGPHQLVVYDQYNGSLQHYRNETVSSNPVGTSSDLDNMTPFEETLLRLSEAGSIAQHLLKEIQQLDDCDETRNQAFTYEKDRKEHKMCDGSVREDVVRDSSDDADPRIEVTSFDTSENMFYKAKKRLVIFFRSSFLSSIHLRLSLSDAALESMKLDQISGTSQIVSVCRLLPLFRLLILCYEKWSELSHRNKMTCSRYNIRSREPGVRVSLVTYEKIAHAAFDGILGIVFGLSILSNTEGVRELISVSWSLVHERLLRNNIGWLETFPAGFKLNVPLTQNMGREILMLLSTQEWLASLLLSEPSRQTLLLRILGFTGITFGAMTLLAIAFDMLRIASFHIAVFHAAFRNIYLVQLHMFSSLWYLFRGKKKNILRQRSDTLEYDSMQLLVGMILFTISLFLLTTVLVYYTFFAVVYSVVNFGTVAIWIAYTAVKYFPLGKLMLRLGGGSYFPKNIHFSIMTKDDVIESIGWYALVGKHNGKKNQGTNWDTGLTHLQEKDVLQLNVVRLVSKSESFGSILLESYKQRAGAFCEQIGPWLFGLVQGAPCMMATRCLNIEELN
uniref:Phosphatidylinositol N-acetylglucosaminyltransferase n=1 Tax=Attheya septentrionalis TaxID=420275 RepID=A0A7S2U6X6_9STRA|mmetsp:Transcript_10899/g.19917  ORF Transcript_10899/g.19917 Transcript_10899/m.19917 type:complete len:738 (+) Transcript_10899:44-2257(+)|eukprot:CAMPEP_0198285600 /NCGR_PEP_ID=MMETSP1449-20131203/4848_1 /TAXON_ID=420275 /ORGANISM="Attheya septentrionalis, Strain CCMP2084" /LENGTH=737 /DNA_ID=CAMNT_0043983073 /DNA_START=40 /DNA_END=2253 /DNA_ORIENTATION=+